MNHPLPKHAVILSAAPITPAMAAYVQPGDTIAACDAGYRNAALLGLVPDLLVGDFDSAPRPRTDQRTIVLPRVKDDTDTHYTARLLCRQGYTRITMLGCLGGARMEHSLANISTALYLSKCGVEVILASERSELHILSPGHPLVLPRKDWKYLSIFPLEGTLSGVVLKGVSYPVENADFQADYPIGVSNEFTAPQACLQSGAGFGLVVLTRADG